MHVLVVLALAACVREEEEGAVSDDTCVEGLRWAGGEEGESTMFPGRDCIACHAREDEGPRFVAAGTVHPDWREPDDCFGVAGVLVELTDAQGATYTAKTNGAGNFRFETEEVALTMPYTARLLYEGRERVMMTPQSSGQCASCHTVSGANDAPGRIVAP